MTEHAWLYAAFALVAAIEAAAFVHRYRASKRHELLQDTVEILVALLQPKRLVAIESDLAERKAETKALRTDVDRLRADVDRLKTDPVGIQFTPRPTT